MHFLFTKAEQDTEEVIWDTCKSITSILGSSGDFILHKKVLINMSILATEESKMWKETATFFFDVTSTVTSTTKKVTTNEPEEKTGKEKPEIGMEENNSKIMKIVMEENLFLIKSICFLSAFILILTAGKMQIIINLEKYSTTVIRTKPRRWIFFHCMT